MEISRLFVVQHEDWLDRVWHPSGSGTLSLDLAQELWPSAEIVEPDSPRHFCNQDQSTTP
jgi:hypothetical protein